ncbi:hypothetical protein [Empedobacter tilapiae]|uniref:Uncharacterized protein n=1 Tax=Empedobacter tilapiae TaxID=2491114 RepID=A0A4Z1BDK8_9FLAO|nr:hypothetical protein [Empedobacter tilapiae]TGN22522.1 hypothetical protein E4J94_15870 [Empedobacter tilapiae]
MEFQLGVSLIFLKRDLAVVVKNEKKEKVIVKEYLLTPTSVEANESFTIGEIKDAFKKVFGKDEKETEKLIEGNLKENNKKDSPFDINKIKFYLDTVFLYKKAYYKVVDNNEVECKEDGSDLKATDKKAEWEYALSISIDSKDFFSDLAGMFSINAVSFSVWNTERTIVKRMMKLGSTEEIFKQLETTVKVID